MPAIQLARLKIQVAGLVEHFADPAAFVRSLHDLLDFYADRTHRPGQAGAPPPLLPAFNAPPPVLRQIVRELAPCAVDDPRAALALSDSLWAQRYLEFRMLAAALLGSIPPQPPQPVLERVKAWAVVSQDDRLLNALLDQGLAGVRQQHFDQYLQCVEEWLAGESIVSRRLGLRALYWLLETSAFENLPVIYRLITPLVRIVPAELRPDLLEVIAALARHSPRETAYFMRQNLNTPENPDTAWLIRQSLAAFSPEAQTSLRDALRESSARL